MSDDTAPDGAVTREDVTALRQSVDNAVVAVGLETEARLKETEALQLKFVTAAEAAETAAKAAATANRAAAKNRRMGRTVALIGAVLAAAIIIALVTRNRQDHADERERVRQAVVACNNSNLSRQAIQDEFDVFITLLGSAGNPPPTPEAAETRRQTIEKFRQDFRNGTPQALRPRDCSEKAVMSPTPLTTTTTLAG